MNKRRFAGTAALIGVIALAGCAAKEAPAPPPEPPPFYSGLQERPEAFDARVLAGKRIVIDPGHGGSFDGALGADSLREADANLGVALYLWGLCEDAGAEAHLTRTADRDYLPAGSQETVDDLRRRVEMANGLEPDVFVSIHHNSNLALDRERNAIEVYYRSSDTGPSLELAGAIELHLARNLGIPVSAVKPGNYFVLRNSTAHAAILGEASFLSHPLVEDRLRLAEKQRLEAQAYFFGLVDYFSRGVPAVKRLLPASDTVASPVEIAFEVRGDAGVALDTSSARVQIGAASVVPLFDRVGSTIRVPMDPDLPNGALRIRGSIRSVRGVSGSSREFELFLNRPARHVVPLAPRVYGESATISLVVLDERGMPVADGTPVVLSSRNHAGWAPSEACRGGIATFQTGYTVTRGALVVSVGAFRDTLSLPRETTRGYMDLRAVDARTNAPVVRPVAFGSSFGSAVGNDAGVIYLPREAASDSITVRAAGYAPKTIDGRKVEIGYSRNRSETVLLEPAFGGVLAGRRIAIDPAGGGAEPGGRGPNALRGAAVNLAVALRLRDLLENAGAVVTLTRRGEEHLSELERVYLVNRADADLAVGIRAGAVPDTISAPRLVLHYPGSATGAAAADTLAASLEGLSPAGAFERREWASLFLQQTSCPAIEIYCGPVEDPAVAGIAIEEAWIRDAALRVLGGLARHFAAGKPR